MWLHRHSFNRDFCRELLGSSILQSMSSTMGNYTARDCALSKSASFARLAGANDGLDVHWRAALNPWFEPFTHSR